jgi:adenine specific DNA methylase Mod
MQPQEKANKITSIIEQLNTLLDQLIDLNTEKDREFIDRQLINKLQCFIVSNDIYTSCLTKWRNELLKRAEKS